MSRNGTTMKMAARTVGLKWPSPRLGFFDPVRFWIFGPDKLSAIRIDYLQCPRPGKPDQWPDYRSDQNPTRTVGPWGTLRAKRSNWGHHQGHRTLDILLSNNIFFIFEFSFKNPDLDGRGTLTKDFDPKSRGLEVTLIWAHTVWVIQHVKKWYKSVK